MGPVTIAKNIKDNSPKILRPTHFSCMKDIEAKNLCFGLIHRFFFAIEVVGVNILHTDLLENKAENLKAN
jgi:hypothetical protein